MGEAQEVEAPWLGATILPPERHETGLLRVQGQPEAREALGEDLLDAKRVPLGGEDQHEVVRVADQEGATTQAWTDLLDPPPVQHLVQVDVREQGGDHSPLWGALRGVANHPTFEHPRSQPLAYESDDDAVRDALLEQIPELPVVDGVEVRRHIDIEDPAPPHLVETLHERLEGVMRGAVGPEAVREVVEVRLVHRLQQHLDGSLEDLVLVRRDPDGASSPVPFGMYTLRTGGAR